jgi:hypothetical protein
MKSGFPPMNNNDLGTLYNQDWQKLSEQCPLKENFKCSVHGASCKDENCPVLFVIRVREREGT